ncbi:TlpA disulfide reductase family protein [Pedobacter sp. P351]|uniref:TlpA family protein disulfide reductase n=1 Tax=Pedobacter superstes TaxID=3133441 RepID=UPI0030AA39A3
MKFQLSIFSLLFLTGCFYKDSKVTGSAKGLKDAVIEISGPDKSWSANVIDEKFELSPRFEKADFYDFKIHFTGGKMITHQIYLDKGLYDIRLNSNFKEYPKIETHVQNQKDLNKYYETQKSDKSSRLETFIKKHPGSLVSAYLLGQNTEEIFKDPKNYQRLYNSLNSEIKNSSHGKKAKKIISGYVRTMVGAKIPEIKGITPDGKPFNIELLKGKLTLIAFWASWYTPGLNDFPQLKVLYDELHPKGFEIVRIAIDKHEERWKKAIADNQLNWLHAADFKGAYSENFELFNTNKLPTYIIVGPDLKIVDFDVPVESVRIYINDFLKKPSAK